MLSVFERLDELDHYALLDVARDVDRKGVKSAYFKLAATFHTDRHFGKKLGAFKSKMELIFGRLTASHDVLANKDRRAEYDEYLVERDRTQAYERLMRMVEGEGNLGDELRASAASIEPAPTAGGELATLPPAGGSPAELARIGAPSPQRIAIAVDAPSSPPPLAPDAAAGAAIAATAAAVASADQERARREMLARRLGGTRVSSTRRSNTGTNVAAPPRATPTAEEARAATDSIRRMYVDKKDGARRAQSIKFVEAAEQALLKDDFVTAANHLRLAVKYTEDPEVHRRFEQINARARELVASAYVKQATYEEQQQKWREAALSYVKAIEGRPDDAELHERAANALRREGRDLHLAARHGELAVQKNPNRADFRVTLGNVYLDAGLFLRARTELEQGHKLDSNAPRLKELLAQVKKLVS
ncbi:MAG: hypothetical protein NVS3B10_05070 [Polyangiales bacterium]